MNGIKLKIETRKRFFKFPSLGFQHCLFILFKFFFLFCFFVSDVNVPRDTYLKMETKMSLFLYF